MKRIRVHVTADKIAESIASAVFREKEKYQAKHGYWDTVKDIPSCEVEAITVEMPASVMGITVLYSPVILTPKKGASKKGAKL